MVNEICKTKVDTPDELLARILDAAACIKKREDQLRRTTRDLGTRVVKCTEDDGAIFRTFIPKLTNFLFLSHEFLIQTLNWELKNYQ